MGGAATPKPTVLVGMCTRELLAVSNAADEDMNYMDNAGGFPTIAPTEFVNVGAGGFGATPSPAPIVPLSADEPAKERADGPEVEPAEE